MPDDKKTKILFAGVVNFAYLTRIGAHTDFAASLTTGIGENEKGIDKSAAVYYSNVRSI